MIHQIHWMHFSRQKVWYQAMRDKLLLRICPFVLAMILGCYSSGQCQAQGDNTIQLTRTIQADMVDFRIDNLGNIYILSADNQLKKLSSTGDSLAVFNDVRKYGKIYSMDVTNPLKILLYYREFSTIVAVDRFLNVLNTIDLRNLNIYQVKAVGLAYDNNVWVYDDLEAKLKRIADDGTLLDQTTDLRQFMDSVPDPATLADQGGLVYLYDAAKGAYVFDHYGSFKRMIPIRGWVDFNVIDQSMLGRNDHFFLKYIIGNINADVEKEMIPAACLPAIKVVITGTSIYIMGHNELKIYSHH